MPRVHEAIGFVVLGVFTVAWIWGGGALLLRRDPGERFWVWITVEQVVASVQAVVGLTLLVLGYRPETWLHYVYGFGPLVILGIALSFLWAVVSGPGLPAGLLVSVSSPTSRPSVVRSAGDLVL